jgi:hypothetical protein
MHLLFPFEGGRPVAFFLCGGQSMQINRTAIEYPARANAAEALRGVTRSVNEPALR